MIDKYLEEMYVNRPTELKELDQVHMDINSAIKTINYLKPFVSNKRILLIGDDDLISLGLLKECKINEITIADIDNRILSYLEKNTSDNSQKVILKEYNVLNALSSDLKNKFDFFYNNPPYGSKNAGDSCKAFALRGIEALKVGGLGAITIASDDEGVWAKKASKNLQSWINSNGCRILDILPNFQTYKNNPIKSTVYLFEKNEFAKLDDDFIKNVRLY